MNNSHSTTPILWMLFFNNHRRLLFFHVGGWFQPFLKHMLVKLDHPGRGENFKIFELPPSGYCWICLLNESSEPKKKTSRFHFTNQTPGATLRRPPKKLTAGSPENGDVSDRKRSFFGKPSIFRWNQLVGGFNPFETYFIVKLGIFSK